MERTTDTLLTPAACFTEAMYLVHRAGGYNLQMALWQLRNEGVIIIHEAGQPEYDRMEALMKIYSSAPMDFADSAVIACAEALNLQQVFTLDRHFYIYRLRSGKTLEIIG